MTHKRNKRLSIVLPAYNSVADLNRLLQSLVPQLNSHELIVINDGSTDIGMVDLLAQYPQVQALHLERNRGSSGARNVGILKASGERIVFIDSDCVAERDCLERHAAFHRRYPTEGCIGNILPQKKDSLLLRFMDYGSSAMFGFHDAQLQHMTPVSFRFLYTANCSLPRQKVLEVGLFDERYNGAWDDIELGYRLDAQGLVFRFDKKAVVYHRNPESYRQFFKRQIRVGRGYWRAHQHHETLLGKITLKNQLTHVRHSLAKARSLGDGVWEKIGFMGIEAISRPFFWYGYLKEKRNTI